MRYILFVQPEAEAEAAEISDHLDGISLGLGLRFFDALEKLYAYIEQYPFGFQKRRNEYRHGYLVRFPDRVAYVVEGEEVHVYQVRHTGRAVDPEFGP